MLVCSRCQRDYLPGSSLSVKLSEEMFSVFAVTLLMFLESLPESVTSIQFIVNTHKYFLEVKYGSRMILLELFQQFLTVYAKT